MVVWHYKLKFSMKVTPQNRIWRVFKAQNCNWLWVGIRKWDSCTPNLKKFNNLTVPSWFILEANLETWCILRWMISKWNQGSTNNLTAIPNFISLLLHLAKHLAACNNYLINAPTIKEAIKFEILQPQNGLYFFIGINFCLKTWFSSVTVNSSHFVWFSKEVISINWQ